MQWLLSDPLSLGGNLIIIRHRLKKSQHSRTRTGGTGLQQAVQENRAH
jgi:hypothetical protein